MVTFTKAEEAVCLLSNLLTLLETQQEKNWSRGIKAAIGELVNTNGQGIFSGFDNARSIYNTMTTGGRGFSEYFVWIDDEDARIKVNHDLDDFRIKLWAIFNN